MEANLELDARMHKTERATRGMMGNMGAPFNFHHKRILNLAVVSRFIDNAKLTAAMISFFVHPPLQPLSFGILLAGLGLRWEK